MSEKLRVKDFTGFIYDLDDTLADNKGPGGVNIHKLSKMRAIKLAGEYFKIPELSNVTIEQEAESFTQAPEHTIESGLTFLLRNLPGVYLTDLEISVIVEFIVHEKNIYHPDIMREYVRPVNGAVDFVAALSRSGYESMQAIATGSVMNDVEVFLSLTGLDAHFTPDRIVAKEHVYRPKPNPESFLLAAKKLKVGFGALNGLLVFEDDPKGIRAAQSAGMQVAGIATRYSAEELASYLPNPSFVFANFIDAGNAFGLSI